jgi:hypothetical protein
MASSGETTLFVSDVLVIQPADGAGAARGCVMQYRIMEYKGREHPDMCWQDAKLELWGGRLQWHFSVPVGRMQVQVRCVGGSRVESEASAASAPKAFLVRRMICPVCFVSFSGTALLIMIRCYCCLVACCCFETNSPSLLVFPSRVQLVGPSGDALTPIGAGRFMPLRSKFRVGRLE